MENSYGLTEAQVRAIQSAMDSLDFSWECGIDAVRKDIVLLYRAFPGILQDWKLLANSAKESMDDEQSS